MTSTAPSAIVLTAMTLRTSVGSTPVKLLPIAISSSLIRAPSQTPRALFYSVSRKFPMEKGTHLAAKNRTPIVLPKNARCLRQRAFCCVLWGNRTLVGWGCRIFVPLERVMVFYRRSLTCRRRILAQILAQSAISPQFSAVEWRQTRHTYTCRNVIDSSATRRPVRIHSAAVDFTVNSVLAGPTRSDRGEKFLLEGPPRFCSASPRQMKLPR